MKICMLLNNPFDPDNRVYREARTLVENGHQVIVLAVKRGKLPKEEVKDGFLIKRVINKPLPFLTKRIEAIKDILKMVRLAISEKADVYHSHDLDTLLCGFIATRKNHAKLIYDSHEFWTDKNIAGNQRLQKAILKICIRIYEKFLIRKVNKVTIPSESAAFALQKKYKLKKKPTVLRNLMHYIRPKYSTKIPDLLGLSPKKKIVLYLGGFFENRGLENLIESSKFLAKNIIIVLIGYGYFEENLREIIKKKNLGERVKILPFVPYEEIVDYASSADIGIAPTQNISFSYYHSLPNKISEYIMSRLPLAVSDFPEMRKIVKKYDIGLTFNPKDPRDIARAINEILDNPQKYKTYKQNLEKAAKDLNWEKESKKLITLYKDLGKL